MTHSRQSKRILSVTVQQMVDDSPDTSHMGEYGNSPTSDFSIDRKHSLDCQINNRNTDALAQVARIHDYINGLTYAPDADYDALEDAQNILIEAQDALQECDCGERGDMDRREYRYFNPSFNYVDKHGSPTDNLTPEEVRKYTRQDYERMERLNRGDWCYVGILAEAEISLSGVTQRITSGGLWGIESDSDNSYFKEVERDELASLREQLSQLGFSRRAIASALRNIERKEAA